MAQVRRYDIGMLSKPVREPNGWVRVDAFLTRTGVFAYAKSDGSQRLEYRPPAEVFNADSLKSFEAVPFTNDHPPEVLDSTNTRKYQVGHLVGAPKQDGDRMRATILVTDAITISDMQRGKLQISNGYLCDVDETPGTSPEGERYDAVQKNIIGNHCALVDAGRAGPEIRARLDAADAAMVVSQTQPIPIESAPGSGVSTMKIRIDGVEVEVPDQVAQLLEKERAASAAALEKTKTDAEKAAARADGLEKEVKDAKAVAAEAPKKARQDVEARLKLEDAAKRICGKDTKIDGVESKDLRKQIAATEAGDVKLDDKSDAYIEVLVDKALAKLDEAVQVSEVVNGTREITQPDQTRAQKSFADAARDHFLAAGRRVALVPAEVSRAQK